MARYIKEVTLNKPIDVVSMIMEDFIYHNRYVRTDWNGEMVFSTAKASGISYLSYYYAAGILHIEAWNRSVFGGEAAPDAVVKSEINKIFYDLKKTSADKVSSGHVGSDPLHHSSNHSDSHAVFSRDTDWQNTSRTAQTATAPSAGRKPGTPGNLSGLLPVFVVGFILAGLFPMFGFILGLILFFKGFKGKPLLILGGAIILLIAGIAIYETIAPVFTYGIDWSLVLQELFE